MIQIQKQMSCLRSPLFSGVCSRITRCFAPDKPFRRLKMRPTCRLEKSGTNHPLRRVKIQKKGDFDRTVPKCASRCIVVTVWTYRQTHCLTTRRSLHYPVFHISSGLVKFHVLSNSVRIPLHPQTPLHRTVLHSLPSSSAPPSSSCPSYTRSTEWASLPLSFCLSLSVSLG